MTPGPVVEGREAFGPRAARPLSAADLAYGMPLGYDDVAPLPPGPHRRRAGGAAARPVAAMEAAIAEGLRRPPCLVSFSGGRDSSALLALAARVARRDGLALPIPATLLIGGSAAANEDAWQVMVLRHLGLEDWVRIEVTDELDVVGPVATEALRRHGLLWPFNAHFHRPIMRAAAGGSVVTGFGGDELALSSATAQAEQVLARRRRPGPPDVAVVGLALAPQVVRARVHRHRAQGALAAMPWLTPTGRATLSRVIGRAEAAIPLGWDRVVRQAIWRSRYFRICRYSLAVLAADWEVEAIHPFLDPRVLDALAAQGGFGGLGDRNRMMQALFGDLLPPAVVKRPTKAGFDDAMWTDAARRFARAWSGGGLDSGLVDPVCLRDHWLGTPVHALSAPLMHAAWLYDAGLTSS